MSGFAWGYTSLPRRSCIHKEEVKQCPIAECLLTYDDPRHVFPSFAFYARCAEKITVCCAKPFASHTMQYRV